MHRHVRESEQRFTAEHVARQAQPAEHHPDHRQRLVRSARSWLLREQQRRANRSEGERRGQRHARRGFPSMACGHLRERELVQIDVPAGGVSKQHQRADGGEQRGGDDRRHSRIRGSPATRRRPRAMNASAVSRTIFGQAGTMLVSCSMSNAQPASTNRPTASATKATNCARLRLGSALSGIPMTSQTTPMPAVPQLVRLSLDQESV